MTWLDRAACQGLPLAESERLFFSAHWGDRLQGLRLCEGCPVQADCLAAAVRFEDHEPARYRAGTWGGLTPNARAAVIA